jgi:hypothetical protein
VLARVPLPDGSIRFADPDGALHLARVAPGVVLFRLVGHDRGQFGDAPFAELAADLARHPTLEVFVDTRAAANATGPVTAQWGRWIDAHRGALRRLHVLVASKYVEHTAELIRFFSRADHLVRVHTDDGGFQAALADASGRPFELGPPAA